VVKWWDRFWGAVWILGSVGAAYLTGRWFALYAAPANLGVLRYGLVAFSALFGLLVGALLISVAVIGITSGVEWLLRRVGHPLRPDAPTAPPSAVAGGDESEAVDGVVGESGPAPTLHPSGDD